VEKRDPETQLACRFRHSFERRSRASEASADVSGPTLYPKRMNLRMSMGFATAMRVTSMELQIAVRSVEKRGLVLADCAGGLANLQESESFT